jgi:outer membrane protein insertion porin family
MRNSCLLSITFLIILSGYCFNLSGQENYGIRKVAFHGNHTLSDGYLLDGMGLKEVSGLEKLLSKKKPTLYTGETISMAMKRLNLLYQSEGFLDIQSFLSPPQVNNKKQVVKLNISVKEGKPVLVDTVTISMKGKVTRINFDSLCNKIFKKLELTRKKRFRDQILKKDVQLIEDAFRKHGYAYVKVDFTLNLRPREYLTGIWYSVDPGPVCIFGPTDISGFRHVTEGFLRKQLNYKENHTYDKSLLDETRRNLYKLQLFRVASVLPQLDPETLLNPIPVKVYIQEAPRLSTNFGVGYGTEDKFRTYVDFTYKGFFGTARRLNINLKHSALVPYSANISWIQPQFFTPKSTAAINPFILRRTEPGLNTRSFGVNIPFTYQFNDYLNTSLTYYLENVKEYLERGDPDFPDRESLNFPYNKSGILLGGIYNNSNPRFTPKGGESITLGFKVNGYLFGGEFDYTRLWGDFRIYREIWSTVVAYRIMIGGIKSSNSGQFIPVEDRFFSGGANSIRGWYRNELGPKRASGSPLGGKSVLETNLEFRFKLFWLLGGVVFLDAGNVWLESYTFRLGELAYAAGPGLRVDTPIGPVRLDVGFPLYNQKKKPQFFISVGQAF